MEQIFRETGQFEAICHTNIYDIGVHKFHWHDRYELCQILRGKCSFRVDGRLIDASAGDIIAINEQIIHQLIVNEGKTAIRIMQFPPKILMNLKSSIITLRPHISAAELSAVSGLAEKLNTLLDLAEDEGVVKFAADNAYLQGIVMSVYFILERHFPDNYTSHREGRDRQEFYKIVEFINEHFREAISVESVARTLFLTRGHASAIFKRYSGTSIGNYVNDLRIKQANSLLRAGVSATEAALESGFSSIRTFNNTYKSVMGMTPSEYKNQI